MPTGVPIKFEKHNFFFDKENSAVNLFSEITKNFENIIVT